MKHALIILLAGGALSVAAMASAGSARDPQDVLAEAVAGREAGTPVHCVNLRDLRGNRSAGEEAIIFDAGSTIYVNRPPSGCPELGSNRALRTRTTSTRLCSGDIAVVFDPVTGMEYGGCGLGDFTPYRRAR